MCVCVSHKSPTAQKRVSCTEMSCLDNQGSLHEPRVCSTDPLGAVSSSLFAFEHSSHVLSNFPDVPTNFSTFIGLSACSYEQMLLHC